MEKDKVLCWKRYKAADADCDATDTIPIPPVIKAAIIANIFSYYEIREWTTDKSCDYNVRHRSTWLHIVLQSSIKVNHRYPDSKSGRERKEL